MLTLHLFGDKENDKFTWAITAIDSRGTRLVTEGAEASENGAKAGILAALGSLVEKLEFKAVGDAPETVS